MNQTVSIPLTRGLVTVVDAADAERVLACGSWYAGQHKCGGSFYAKRNIRQTDGRRTLIKMETFLLGTTWIDHINGDTLDNRRSNLRLVTHQQNNLNRASHRGSSSRYKGVHFRRDTRKWQARIRIHGRDVTLGCFTQERDAARAYDVAACAAFGEFARLNFPLIVVPS